MFGSAMIDVTCVLIFLLLMPTAVTSEPSRKKVGIVQQTIPETAENDDQNFPKQEDDDTSLRYSPGDTDPPNKHCATDTDAPCTAEEKTRSADGQKGKQKANSEKPPHSTLSEGGAALHEACRQGLQDRVKAVLATHPAVINERNEYGQTALHLAVAGGHFDIVDVLLTRGADVDPPDSLGWTPLHVACRQGDLRVVKRLHASGANMSATTVEMQTPLLIAARHLQTDVFKYVAEQNININAQDSEGSTAGHLAISNDWEEVVNDAPLKHNIAINIHKKNGQTLLYTAAEMGSTDIVAFLLQNGADTEIAYDGEAGSMTPLFIASQNGHKDVVTLLIVHGADKDFTRQDGKTPLYMAAKNGHTSVVQTFLQHGVNVNWHDNNLVTSLIVASAQGHVEVVKLLLAHGADVHWKDKWGKTAMDHARWEGHPEVLHLLKQKANDGPKGKHKTGSDKPSQSRRRSARVSLYVQDKQRRENNARTLSEAEAHLKMLNNQNIWGQAALHQATRNGNSFLGVIDLLLNQGVDVDPHDILGWTPLHFACRQGDVGIVIRLRASGANVNASTDEKQTPIQIAVKYGHVDVVRYLKDEGADVHAKDSEGNTAFSLADWNKRSAIVDDAPLQYKNATDILKKRGKSPLYLAAEAGVEGEVRVFLQNQTDPDTEFDGEAGSMTPLFIAAQNGHINVVRLLIEYGANKTFTRQDGKTPMFMAAKNGHTSVVQTFLQHGVNVNWRDNNLVTSLIVASLQGHVVVVKLLLAHGADVSMKEKWGTTAIYHAKWEGQFEVLDLLEQNNEK